GPEEPPAWDLAYVSATLTANGRPDLFLEVARRRPELRFALAGKLSPARELERAALAAPNVDWLGWVDDPRKVMARSRAVFYGLDPRHPYSSSACPNTLYDALRVRRPLIFFCGGEPEELLGRFRIGIKCAPTADALLDALDEARGGSSWEFDAALTEVDREPGPQEYVEAVFRAAQRRRRLGLGG